MSVRGLVVGLLAGLLVLVFGVGPASAAAPVLLNEFASTDGLESPQAVAVDQASGDVYVIDIETKTVDRFDARGNPVAFTATGSYINANRLSGTPTESFRFFEGQSELEIAVDNSGGPFNGDVYVTDSGHGRVDVFASDGAYLGQLDGSGTPQGSFTEPCGVAVDGSGRVYVGDYGGFVERYTPSASAMPIADEDYTVSEISGVSRPCAVAVDSAGDVYASTWPSGPLNEFAAGQFPASGSAAGAPRLIDSTSDAVAVDPLTGHVYVDEGAQVAEYETSGTTPELLEMFGSLSGESDGVAVHDVGGIAAVYASDEGFGEGEGAVPPTVYIYGAPVAARPVVVSESAANVTGDSADIQAQIDPEFADTTYHFEYGPTSSYGASVPLMERDIGSAGGPLGVQSVSPVHLTGLQPDTTYHYRVVARNSAGTTEGADATFTTQSASGLLDGRAYELVSPPEKEGATLLRIDGYPGPTGGGVIQAEPEGNALTYISNSAFAEPVSSPLPSQYLATRGAGGWSNVNVTPPMLSEAESATVGGLYRAFSSDLSSGLLMRGSKQPSLDPEAPAGFENYVLHSGLTGAGPGGFQAALLGPVAEHLNVELEGANPELTHIVFRGRPYSPTDSGELFEWTPGQSVSQLQPISPDAVLGRDYNGYPGGTNAVSGDGSRVFFTYRSEDLDLRENGTTTISLDAAQGGPESGGGVFWTASNDGSRAFFTDRRALTTNASGSGEKGDLYMFEAAGGKLTDIAPGGSVLGVLGASEDGSYVYFVANGVLASGASPGNCQTEQGRLQWRVCNLYVWHNGTTTFIATLSDADESERRGKEFPEELFKADDWSAVLKSRTARVSSDGKDVVFMSDGDLTGYDSRNAETGQREQEVYVYDAVSGVLRCVSCDPTGARPWGPSGIPGATAFGSERALYQSRVLSDEDGRARVFFDSADALVPQDTNGAVDVYEWEEDERGGCRQAGGCLGLISSGTSSEESVFLDAGTDGDDVFFLTNARLAAQDIDNLADVYDARAPHVPGEVVGSAMPVPTPPPCSNGDSCRPPVSVQSSLFGSPASATFTGAGNPMVSATPLVVQRSRPLTRAQKLAKALAVCRKKRRNGRASCEAQARKRYGAGSGLRRDEKTVRRVGK